MNFTLSKPCKNCPFRSDLESNNGWLGELRASEISESLREYAFPCHKTTNVFDMDEDEDEDEDENMEACSSHKRREQLCYGAAVLMHKEGVYQTNRMIAIAKIFKLLDPNKKYEENIPIFNSFEEFIKAHSEHT